MHIDPKKISVDLGVTGIAEIPNQHHHEVRRTHHVINIALIGDDGLGKTDFINRCLKQKIFTDPRQKVEKELEVRIRRAELTEAGFRAQLNLIDVPHTGFYWDRELSYNAIVQYGQEKIEEFGKLAASPKRQATLPDGRISAALFFVNALTTTRLSSLEMSTLKELAKFTNVILVIAKSDCLLPAELARIKFNIAGQIQETAIELFSEIAFAVASKNSSGMPKVHLKEPRLETLLFKMIFRLSIALLVALTVASHRRGGYWRISTSSDDEIIELWSDSQVITRDVGLTSSESFEITETETNTGSVNEKQDFESTRMNMDQSDRFYGRPRPQPSHSSQPVPIPGYVGGVSMHLLVTKAPSEALALTNCIFVHPSHLTDPSLSFVILNGKYRFKIRAESSMEPGRVGMSKLQRTWGKFAFDDEVSIEPVDIRRGTNGLAESMTFQIDFMRKGSDQSAIFDSGKMAEMFHTFFDMHIFTTGQKIAISFQDFTLTATVHEVKLVGEGTDQEQSSDWAVLTGPTVVRLFAGPESSITITGSIKSTFNPNAILDPGFRFGDLGIGGLDDELLVIFRRAFTSRLFPPEFIRSLGIQPVRGILLHGPPGTGKTLIARQIGKVLNSHEPKIVNGPEILNKYVGQSEENIRNLFKEAEAEFKAKGDASQLHVIIFDEIDAICKQRGSRGDSTGVGDSVVTQLLSKLDGVDQLDNILVIGLTNRFDLIDEALLRPGRLELHLEIGLPDESGRREILNIHTALMRRDNRLAPDLELKEIAALSKNFSGAELAGLVKAAASVALTRHIRVGTVAAVTDDYDQVQVGREDFMIALQDIRPAFGSVEQELTACGIDGIIHFSEDIQRILDEGASFTRVARTDPRNNLVSVLIHGLPGAGKTALAAKIAQSSGFPFVKILSPHLMKGMSEQSKVAKVIQVFTDAYKSELSCIIVDDIERLLDWNRIGPRFSLALVNLFETVLKERPPDGRRLLLLTTTSSKEVLEELGMKSCFKHFIRVPSITTLHALENVLQATIPMYESDIQEILSIVKFAVDEEGRRFSIAIQDLIALIGHAASEDENISKCFLGEFESHYI